MNIKLLLIIFMLSVALVAGQTVAQIEEVYEKPTLAYSVTEHIWMTPDFAADGQVCRMRFYLKRVGRDIAYLGGHLNSAELKWILNHVVPPASRGNRKTNFGFGNIGGGMAEMEYEYEKVSFIFVYSVNTHIDPKSLQKGEWVDLDFPVSAGEVPKPTPALPSESDFDQSASPEIVIVRWNDRTCVQDDNANEPRVAEIEQRFGQPQKIYSVDSYISMTVDFGTDGQACRMSLFPKRVSADKSYLGNTLGFDKLRHLLNTLVPPEQRGLKQKENFSTTATGGGSAWTTYPYENVLFTFIACGRISKSSYSEPLLRRGEFTFTIPYPIEPVVKDRLPSQDDFLRTADTEIATIRWQRRTCVGL